MKDDFDVEAALRRFEPRPDERTRRAVMDRFRRTHRRRPASVFLGRRIPLYAAAAALLISAVLSFAAGEWQGRRAHESVESENAGSPARVEWATA